MRITLETLPRYCHEDGDCLIWDGGLTGHGYPSANINGGRSASGARSSNVRRWVLAQHGIDLTDKRVISICHNTRCLNHEHLSAMTPKAATTWVGKQGLLSTPQVKRARTNSARARPATKMTMDKARFMRARRAEGQTLTALAAEFGVSPDTAWKITRGLSWREHVANSSVFNQQA